MSVPLAHAGHWFVSALYILPLAVAIVALKVKDYREKHPKSDPEPPPEDHEE